MAQTEEWLGWHFLPQDGRLYGLGQLPESKRVLVEAGQTYHVELPLVLCEHGLHASKRALDALQYAPGPIICRVRLAGDILEDTDKACATERLVLWMVEQHALCLCHGPIRSADPGLRGKEEGGQDSQHGARRTDP